MPGESIRAPGKDPSSIRTARSREAAEARLALTDPAVQVVTDFVLQQPVTVPEELPIDDALREMIRAGLRALLVVRDEVVTGLITSYDIQGERPLQFLTKSGYRRHDEIKVGHIMTRWERVATLDWQALGHARVSDLAAFFRSATATHVVMVEHTDQGGTAVRGVISRTRLERQLGALDLTGGGCGMRTQEDAVTAGSLSWRVRLGRTIRDLGSYTAIVLMLPL